MNRLEKLTEYIYSDFLNIIEEETQIELIKYNPFNIILVSNPTERVQLTAISDVGTIIKYINKPTEKVQMAAIKNNIRAIHQIKNPSENIQIEVIKQSPSFIRYLKNPSEKVKLEAVKIESYSIEFIQNPEENIQIEAVKNLPLDNVTTFILKYLNKIISPIALSLLYKKTKNQSLKERIKKSPYWKDDANLILEAINE